MALPKPNKATIADVAKAAGVSTGTVSRVLNERPGVKAQTKAQVLATIEELGYKPDAAARELSANQGKRIGLHVATGERRMVLIPYFMLFLEHLIEELQNDGFRLHEIPSRADGLPEYLTDGMVLLGAYEDDPRVTYLQKEDTPFVLVGHSDEVRSVAPDDLDGGKQAARHLLKLGHTDIVHVSGFTNSQASFDRYEGFKAVLGEAGLESPKSHLLDGEFTSLGAYRSLRKAYERGLRFSAVFAASDEMALGVIAALEDVGLRVPADVSVVGFDDLPGVAPNLTTVRQDIAQIAAATVDLLQEGLRGEPVRSQVMPVQLVVRGTSSRKR